MRTVPDGMAPGSDVANLAVLGYDPAACFTGRSPLEAASIGVELGPDDVAYRLNLVTVAGGLMKDNTAGHIPNDEARRCVEALQAELGSGAFEFHVGVSYRHLLVWRGGHVVPCTPPHDILDKPVAGHLPGEAAGVAGDGTPAATLTALQEAADAVLDHERPGTSAWFWGEGTAPHIEPFREHYGLSGAVVGAVDLVRGIGRLAGLDVIDVPGATGGLDTDYGAKARAALAALEDHDLVWVHVEAPDEAGHMGDLREKVRAIERVDRGGPRAHHGVGRRASRRARGPRPPHAAAHAHARRRSRALRHQRVACRAPAAAVRWATARRRPRRPGCTSRAAPR